MKNNPKNNKEKKAKLTVSRSEAKSKLLQTYDVGKEIKEIVIFSESELEETEVQYKKWSDNNVKLLKSIFDTEIISNEYFYTSGVTIAKVDKENPFPGRHKNFRNTLDAKLNKLESIINRLESFPTEFGSVEKPVNENRIFVGRSRSKFLTKLIAFLEEKLGIKTITYDSESKKDDPITSVSEKILNAATFAILVLTTDDETKDDRIKVHRSLVYETGLFQGKLGFKKVLILHQRGIGDLPDFTKAHSIKLNDENIEQTFNEIEQILKNENIIK